MLERNTSWLDSQIVTDADRREFETERLIQLVTGALAAAIEDSGMTQTEVAQRLGKSGAYVSQVLSGRRNCTLKTLAEIAWACDHRLEVGVSVMQPTISSIDASKLTSTVISLRRFSFLQKAGTEAPEASEPELGSIEVAA